MEKIIMSINTPYNVTLTEGQIGVILCSLENSTKYADSEYIEEVDGIFQILEGAVDKNDYIDRLMAQYLDFYNLEIKEHEITNIEEYTLEAT